MSQLRLCQIRLKQISLWFLVQQQRAEQAVIIIIGLAHAWEIHKLAPTHLLRPEHTLHICLLLLETNIKQLMRLLWLTSLAHQTPLKNAWEMQSTTLILAETKAQL